MTHETNTNIVYLIVGTEQINSALQVSPVDILNGSQDGQRVVVGICTSTKGVLDVISTDYQNLIEGKGNVLTMPLRQGNTGFDGISDSFSVPGVYLWNVFQIESNEVLNFSL